MRVLIVISLFAASGLVWASLSMAQHVRRSRRQQPGVIIPDYAEDAAGMDGIASASDATQRMATDSAEALAGKLEEAVAAPPMPPPPNQARSLVQAWAAMRRQEIEDAQGEPAPPAEPAGARHDPDAVVPATKIGV